MPSPAQTHIIKSLDERILADPAMGPELFARSLAAQRELGLLHGDRPTCPFLRPHILGRSQYEAITGAAQTIAAAFETLVDRALVDQALLDELGLTPTEELMARIDPGYARLCVTSRLDAYIGVSGFKFLEYNAESPAGIGDQMQLEKVLFELPQMKDFLRRHEHWLPEPHRLLLASLLSAYREWGGVSERPQIAIVDWAGVSTESEFVVLKQYFETEGYPTVIADPRALKFDGHALMNDDFRIDIVYKRVVIHEFLEKFDEHHPLARAYAERKVCMANSFRTKMAHKKAGFAILSDPRHQHLFTDEQVRTIHAHIPWTRRVRPGTVVFEAAERDLVEILRTERERLVLKPNDDYGGHGVVIGWETDAAEWERAITVALERPYVVQERAPIEKLFIPMFGDRAHAAEMNVDFNPFLFHNEVEGALVRLSASSLSNVSSGGGQTALLVLEGM
jgi:glutathionylspermidine synthase